MPQLIVTTALAVKPESVRRAEQIASELGAPLAERRKRDLPELFECFRADRAIVVEHGGLALVHLDGTVYRYHPNLGYVRAFNVERGQTDMFLEAADIRPGERVLDCTIGFGSEALLASIATGPSGKVVGLESVPELATLTRYGIHERKLASKRLEAAMRRIEIVSSDYRDYIERIAPGEFDLIAFDPFFCERTHGSEANIDPLFRFGDRTPLDSESVLTAIQKATRRVLVKHPAHSELPDNLCERRKFVAGARRRAVCHSVFDAASVHASADSDPSGRLYPPVPISAFC
jgi:hypothetical protein